MRRSMQLLRQGNPIASSSSRDGVDLDTSRSNVGEDSGENTQALVAAEVGTTTRTRNLIQQMHWKKEEKAGAEQ